MTKIVLRHGESSGTGKPVYAWTDIDLSDQGRAEAKRLGSCLGRGIPLLTAFYVGAETSNPERSGSSLMSWI
jgi:broad specificity phosphatase PhoE